MTSVMPRSKQPAPKLTPEELKAKMAAAIAEAQAARPVAAKALEKSRSFVILDHAFFSDIMMQHPMIERLDIPTLAVTARGTIFYNPAFVAKWSTKQLVWAICHEVMHYAGGHAIRRGNRDPKKWNWACDAWINDMLDKAKVGEPIPGCVSRPGSAEITPEEIYDTIPPDDDGDEPGDDPGDEQGDQPGGDDPLGDDISDEGEQLSESEVREIDGQRKIEVAKAAQAAKIRGQLPGVLSKFATDAIESKTPWFDVLERYMVDRVNTDYTWKRKNRRYEDVYLPSVDGVGAMGEIVIQTDISGSISEQEIRYYNGHMKRIVEQCRPRRVHVVYTDTEVQRHDVFDRPEDVQIEFMSGGGTDMRAGFDFINKEGIEPEVVITLTDGYTPFPESTDFPSVWCISTKDIESPTGTNVHFDMND